MFGDTEANLEKHRTAARTRSGILNKLEHTKPLYLIFHCYYSIPMKCWLFIIFTTITPYLVWAKFHTPISIFDLFYLSKRKETRYLWHISQKTTLFTAVVLTIDISDHLATSTTIKLRSATELARIVDISPRNSHSESNKISNRVFNEANEQNLKNITAAK